MLLLSGLISTPPATSGGLPLLLPGSGATSLSQADLNAIAAAVWGTILEGTLTAEQIQRINLAALAGKRQGLGTATEEYLAQDGVTPRVTFTPSDASGNGTTVVDGS
jgi:hypothetical protein